VAGVLDYGAPATRFILLFTLAIVPEGMNRLIQAAFMSQERFVPPALVVLTASAVRLLAAGAVLLMGGRLELLAGVQVFTSFLSWVLYAVLLRRRETGLLPDPRRKKGSPGSTWRQALDGRFLREQARLSVPFALMEIFLMVEWQIDIVLVSVFLSERDVGYYGAALTVVSLFYFALSAYSAAIYPVMTRLYQSNRENLWSLYRRLVLYVAMAVLPLTVLLVGAASWLTTTVFGPEFAVASLALQWLVCSVAIRFFDEPNSRLIIIAGHQKEAALFLGLSMVLNIVANCLLIPRFGIIGSAWARLLSTLLFVVLNGVFAYGRISHINLLPTIGKLALALGAMGAVLYATQGASLWLRATLGGAAYVMALILVRYVPGEDRRRVREAAVRCWQRVRSPAKG
jgi:O-antigen/teichoic acid export membrane protein